MENIFVIQEEIISDNDRLEKRVKQLEDERNIYKGIFKDRDETSLDDNHETSDLETIFDDPKETTLEEFINKGAYD